jgi:WD40 repeat protein/outer membrane biosynthesis protein TonB
MFDPYHKWLGISKHLRPPTFYQLLGVDPDEEDADVIKEAAIRQTTHVRAYQVGPHATECTQLLNEIAQARQTLLNPAKRKEYDAKLAGASTERVTPQVKTALPGPPRGTTPGWLLPAAIGAVVLVLGGLGLTASLLLSSGPPDESKGRPPQKAPAAAARPVAKAPPVEVVEKEPEKPVPVAVVKKVEGPKVEPTPVPESVVPVKQTPKQAPTGEAIRPMATAQVGAGYSAVAPTKQPDEVLLAGHKVVLYDQAGQREVRFYGPKSDSDNAVVAIAPDGKRFFAATDHLIGCYDLKTAQKVGEMAEHERGKRVTSLSVSSDGKMLLSTSQDKTVRVWDTGRFKSLHVYDGHKGSVLHASLSADGQRIVSCDPGEVIVWDVENGSELKSAPLKNIQRVAFAPEGDKVVAFDLLQRQMLVLDAETLEVISKHPDAARSGNFVFSPGGKYLITYPSAGGALYRWDWPELQVKKPLEGHSVGVVACAPAPDGMHLYSLGRDQVLLKWPLDDPPQLAAMPAPEMKAEMKMAAPIVRGPVPDQERIKQEEKNVFELLKVEYAAAKKNVVERIALVEKLLQLAGESKDNSAERYALLNEARTQALTTAKVPLVLQAVEELTRYYTLDPLETKKAALTAMAKIGLTKESAAPFTEAAITAYGEAVLGDRLNIAADFISLADAGAKKALSKSLTSEVGKHQQEIKQLTKEFDQYQAAKERLKKDADDAEANVQVGTYYALRKGDWEQGLALLAKGKEGTLVELARKDVMVPEEAQARLDRGDAWWDAAEKETGWQKQALQWRAAFWYRQALPGLTGLTQVRAEKRLKQVDDQPAPLLFADNLGEVRRLKGHTGAVTYLAFALDGKRLYSGGLDGVIRYWDPGTGKQVYMINVAVPMLTFSFSPANTWLAVCTSDTIRAFDLRKLGARTPRSWEGVPGAFWIGADALLRVDKIGTFERNNLDAGNRNRNSTAIQVRVMIPSPDRSLALVLGDEGVKLQQTKDIQENPLTVTATKASAGAISPDNKTIAFAAPDQTIRIYDAMSLQETQSLPAGHTGAIKSIAFTPNGQRLVTGGDDKSVRVWDLSAGKELRRYSLHTGAVLAVAVSPDGRFAFSGSTDKTIRQWSLPP